MHRKTILALFLAACASPAARPTTPPPTPAPTPPVAAPVAAPVATPPPAAPRQVTQVEGVTELQLDNGLRVLLFPDDSQPKVTVETVYLVGSRHEGYGESGMAHLLEHMQFKGTATHGNIMNELQKLGADFNASTSYDRTEYHETLPAGDENLDVVLGIEADRMLNSKIAAEDLASEFSVVRNEFERNENEPGEVLEQRMLSTAYLWHNYGKAIIGSRADIERVPIDNLRAFYRNYYQPDNAVLILTGKFDAAKALALIGKHFGALPRPTRKLSAQYTVEPVQDGERDVILRRNGDTQLIGVVYHLVAGSDDRAVAAEAIPFLMNDQPSGRLYKALVKTGLATSVSGYYRPMTEPGFMLFLAEVPAGKPLEPVRDKMVQVIEGLAKDKPTEDEVSHFKARAIKNLELAMTNAAAVNSMLVQASTLGDWRMAFVRRDRIEKLGRDMVAQLAADYLKQSNRTVGLFIPTKAPDRTPLPDKPDVAALVKDYKGRPPVAAGEVFDATIENVEKRTTRSVLPGGLKLALLPKQTRGKAVRLVLTLHGATEKDLLNHEEAAGMVGSLLMRGSKKYTQQQIKDELDRLKAQVAMHSDATDASVSITTTSENLVAVIDMVAEIMQEPTFPKDQFEIMKKEEITKLESQLSDPEAVAVNELERRMHPWPATDIRYVPTLPEEIARTKAMTLDDVKRIHKTFWGASHAEVTVVGDFDPAAVTEAVKRGFGSWKTPRPYERIAIPYKKVEPASVELDTPDKENALVLVAMPVELRDDDPDYPALFMVNYILGGNLSSRLWDRLRQREGWSYTVQSSLQPDSIDRRATFEGYAISAPQNVDKARAAMLEEIGRMLKDGPTAEELAKSKASYRAKFTTRMANDGFLLAVLQHDLYLGRTFEFQKKVNDAIDKLTLDDIMAVLKKGRIHVDGLVKVVGGDLKKRNQPAPTPPKADTK